MNTKKNENKVNDDTPNTCQHIIEQEFMEEGIEFIDSEISFYDMDADF